MPGGVHTFKRVGVGLEQVYFCFPGFCKPTQCLRYVHFLTCAINFGSIAGRENRHFLVGRKAGPQSLQGLCQLV